MGTKPRARRGMRHASRELPREFPSTGVDSNGQISGSFSWDGSSARKRHPKKTEPDLQGRPRPLHRARRLSSLAAARMEASPLLGTETRVLVGDACDAAGTSTSSSSRFFSVTPKNSARAIAAVATAALACAGVAATGIWGSAWGPRQRWARRVRRGTGLVGTARSEPRAACPPRRSPRLGSARRAATWTRTPPSRSGFFPPGTSSGSPS